MHTTKTCVVIKSIIVWTEKGEMQLNRIFMGLKFRIKFREENVGFLQQQNKDSQKQGDEKNLNKSCHDSLKFKFSRHFSNMALQGLFIMTLILLAWKVGLMLVFYMEKGNAKVTDITKMYIS